MTVCGVCLREGAEYYAAGQFCDRGLRACYYLRPAHRWFRKDDPTEPPVWVQFATGDMVRFHPYHQWQNGFRMQEVPREEFEAQYRREPPSRWEYLTG
jgi:hypothetical protein